MTPRGRPPRASALALVSGLPEQPGSALFTLGPDRVGTLAGGLEDACRFLADQPSCRLVVDDGGATCAGQALLQVEQLTLEETLTLLQASKLGGDHAQEVANFLLVEPAPASVERRLGDGGR